VNGRGENLVAVVLTMDAQIGLAELVHKRYARMWPDNPFTFRIPYNGTAQGPAQRYLAGRPDCELVGCGAGIRESMGALLDGVGDRSWVFWCIDDRFPTWLDRDRLSAVTAALPGAPDGWEEIKLLRWREPVTRDLRGVAGSTFLVQDGARHRGFWHHHFVRAGVLRRVFSDRAVGDGAGIQDFVFNRLQGRGGGRRLSRRVEARLFPGTALVPTAPLARLGEPVVEGRLTRNGLVALRGEGCEVPPYEVVDRNVEYTGAEP
jgi:hypothetical protein